VAVDSNSAYWSQSGPQSTGVFSGSKDGSGGVFPLVPVLQFPYQVLSDGHLVYYNAGGNGTVGSVDPSTGLPTTFAASPTPYTPTGLALSPDAGTLYWLGTFDDGGISVHAQPLPSGREVVLTLDTDGTQGLGLAADEAAVFFTAGVSSPPNGQQNLKRIDAAGCPDAGSCGTILHTSTFINAVAVDETYVYWAEQPTRGGGGVIARRGKGIASGGYLVLAPLVNNAQFILVDGPWVYWTEFEPSTSDGGPTGAVGRVAKDGTGGVTYLADHQAYPLGMASDATAIYWVNRGTATNGGGFANADGQILLLAK
jgi:hypothetical protein